MPDTNIVFNNNVVQDGNNQFYTSIVCALAAKQAAQSKLQLFKFWLDEKCQVLKVASQHNYCIWVDPGRPFQGPLTCNTHKARVEYTAF